MLNKQTANYVSKSLTLLMLIASIVVFYCLGRSFWEPVRHARHQVHPKSGGCPTKEGICFLTEQIFISFRKHLVIGQFSFSLFSIGHHTSNSKLTRTDGGGRVVRWCWVNFQCRGVLQLDYSRARAYCTCSRRGWGLFRHFYSRLSFLFSFSLSLGDGPI